MIQIVYVKKSRRIGCVIPHCKLQLWIMQLEIGILSFDLTGQWLVNDWSKFLAGQKWSKVVFCKKFSKWLFLVLGDICRCQKEVCIPQNNTFFGLNEENYWQLSSFAHLPPWKYLILVVFTNNSLTSQKGFAQSISQNFWLVNWPVSRSKFRSLVNIPKNLGEKCKNVYI